MLAVLLDKHSLGYYRRVAETIEPLSIVKQMSREGIQKSRGALFVPLLNDVPPLSAGAGEEVR